MANFATKIENKYPTKTYDEVKSTYCWIFQAITNSSYMATEVNSKFHFYTGAITCSCKGLDEFTEYAYGQDGFDLVSLEISAYSDNYPALYITVDSFESVRISTESKAVLEDIISSLQRTSLENSDSKKTHVTYIETQNNGVMIQGDNNTVANNHSTISTNTEEPKEPKLKQWLRALAQNLLANGVWYLLCVLFSSVVTWFALKH